MSAFVAFCISLFTFMLHRSAYVPTLRYLTVSTSGAHFTTSAAAKMPNSDPTLPNATGLTPEESRKLPKREVQEDEQSIMKGLRELYTCAPTSQTYSMYTEDAVFHDPVSIARGLSAIKAQFNALPALFPRADITKLDVLESPSSLPPKTMVVDQNVAYYRKKEDSEPFKELNSLLTLQRDQASGLVKKHTEEWDHKPETDESNAGFGGSLNELRKKVGFASFCRRR